VRLVSRRDDGVDDEQPGLRRCRSADRPEDRRRSFVVPVMEDPREDVGVAARYFLEEAAGDEGNPFAEGRLVAVCLRQVEDEAANVGHLCEQRLEQGTVATADVDHGLVASPLELGQPLRGPFLPACHRSVEGRPLAGALGEPRPEVRVEHTRERLRLRRWIHRSRAAVEHAAEEVRELGPAPLRARAEQV
jgi:hypothetical protein